MKYLLGILLSILAIVPAHAQEKPEYTRLSDQELREKLSQISWEVTQEAATERAFTGEYWDEKRPGLYVDITSDEPLFFSFDKFDSGCGWPSFVKPIEQPLIEEKTDLSFGMQRTEVVSAGSGAHLGHVFTDGPRERGGLRYCINSASLRFIPYEEMEKEGYGWLIPQFDKEAEQWTSSK